MNDSNAWHHRQSAHWNCPSILVFSFLFTVVQNDTKPSPLPFWYRAKKKRLLDPSECHNNLGWRYPSGKDRNSNTCPCSTGMLYVDSLARGYVCRIRWVGGWGVSDLILPRVVMVSHCRRKAKKKWTIRLIQTGLFLLSLFRWSKKSPVFDSRWPGKLPRRGAHILKYSTTQTGRPRAVFVSRPSCPCLLPR